MRMSCLLPGRKLARPTAMVVLLPWIGQIRRCFSDARPEPNSMRQGACRVCDGQSSAAAAAQEDRCMHGRGAVSGGGASSRTQQGQIERGVTVQ